MARVQRENLREAIIEAAEKRLWHYGIKKTTIDEIASDAGVGKGTVYLYFESKEDVAFAIMAKYKEESLAVQTQIARDHTVNLEDRIRQVITLPILNAHRKCQTSPHAVEVILTLKPHLARQMRPYFEQEVALIAELLEEGNRIGLFGVADSMTDARTLKQSTLGLLPPYPCVEDPNQIEPVLLNMVALALRAFKCKH